MAVMPDVDAKWSVRLQQSGSGARAYVRRSTFDVGSQATLRDDDPSPSGVEYALAALGGDLVCGLQREARSRRIGIEEIELLLSGRLNNVLVHLGVVGESGHAGFEHIGGVLYVRTDAAEAELQEAWETVLVRSPLFNTLSRACEIAIALRPVV